MEHLLPLLRLRLHIFDIIRLLSHIPCLDPPQPKRIRYQHMSHYLQKKYGQIFSSFIIKRMCIKTVVYVIPSYAE